MTKKEYIAESARIETAKAEAQLLVTRRKMESGFQKLQADVEKAERDLAKSKIVQEEEYDALKLAVRHAELDVEECKAYEESARATADKGFDE